MKVVCYGPFRAASLLWQPSPGAWAFTVACHAVFELTPNQSPVVAKPLPLDPVKDDDERASVEPWGPPAPRKQHPEVVVVGHAYAPPGSKATSLAVRLGVGDLEKVLDVHGPIASTRMPLRWDRAAGSDQVLRFIAGSERILLSHLHPRFPQLVTHLEATTPCVVASLAGVEQSVPVVCDTLVVDSDRGLAFLVWRGEVALPHPRQEGVVFVSAARLGSTGTLDGAPAPGRAALPFQGAGADVATLAGTSVPARPALPFRPVVEDAPSTEVGGDAEIVEEVDAEDADPPTLRHAALAKLTAKADPPRALELVGPAPAPAPPPPPPRPTLPERTVSPTMEQCAAIAARLASPGADRAAILAAEQLTPEAWEREHVRSLSEINDELDRGNKKLHDLARQSVDPDTQQVIALVFEQHREQLTAYDTAYVAALEKLRGPIAPAEFARLSRAADRGDAAPVLAELRLPEGAMSRIRRVWRARMAEDPRVAAEVGAALQAAKP